MLVIEITFNAGRFHANPWGRHINEGVAEWPPSPYRLVRALFDAWKRKRPDWPEDRVRPLLEALASDAPRFHLPTATTSHTRSYLSENKREVTAKQLIFDAFIVVDRGAVVLAGWQGTELSSQQRADLDELLGLVNYLGRSESWVAMRVVPGVLAVDWNCEAESVKGSLVGAHSVPVACPIAPREYATQPYTSRPRSKTARPKTISWIDALAWTTKEVQASRLSDPPAMRNVTYYRRDDCFEVTPQLGSGHPKPAVNGVRYALESKVRPPVTAALEVAERFRSKIMGIHKRIVGDPEKVSPQFSGKNSDGKPLQGHQHVFILPIDEDGDGWLDHLVVACRQPLDFEEQLALDRADSLWQPDGKPDLRLMPLRWGTLDELFPAATRFASVTPFVTPRHYRRGRGDFYTWLAKEVCREARHHGLPEPSAIRPVARLETRRRPIRWIEFRRNRKEHPIRPGFGFELEFPESIQGPVALGYAGHFGLGLFRAVA